MKQTKTSQFSLLLPVLILIALAINLWLVFSFPSSSDDSFEELELTFITTNSCEECFSLEAFEDYFKQNDVDESQMRSVDINSLTGRYLRYKYQITQAPTVIIAGDVESFDFMQGLVDSIGDFRKDAFVVTELQPPYLDLENDRIVGEYSAIYLNDSTCTECYDVSDHDAVFERLAMKAKETQIVDISSEQGVELIDKYVISAIPTIILSGELDVYEGLQQIWPSVGTIEEDGAYVLRKGVEQMGTYKLIPENELVTPELPEQPAPPVIQE